MRPREEKKVTWIGDIAPLLRPRVRRESHNPHVTGVFNYSKFRHGRLDVCGALHEDAAQRAAHRRTTMNDGEWETLTSWLDTLSAGERAHVHAWAADPASSLMDTTSKADLMQALQTAIEVEIATIPPYIAAMYSAQETTGDVHDIFHRVIYQEMRHFGLAANILLSIGGTPDVLTDEILEAYPKDLPGLLGNGLIVPIRKMDAGTGDPGAVTNQLGVFMAIETPNVMRDPKSDKGYTYVDDTCTRVDNPNTIGDMYADISTALTNLYNSGEITFGHTDLQVATNPKAHVPLTTISSLQEALSAITSICDEGEGVSGTETGNGLDPRNPETGNMAHYFAFAEIAYGKKIIVHETTDNGRKTCTGFDYNGATVDMGALTIYNMRDNPTIAGLPDKSTQQSVARNFANAWHNLLEALNTTFSGQPQFMGVAVDMMMKIEMTGLTAMTTPMDDGSGTTVGLPFEKPSGESTPVSRFTWKPTT